MHINVKFKIFGALGGVVLLAVVLGVVSITMLGSVNSSAVRVGKNGVAAETSLATIGQIFNKLRKDQVHYFIAKGSYAGVKGDIDGDLSDMTAALKAYAGSTPAEQSALKSFRAAFDAYVAASQPMFALVANGQTPAAEKLIGDGGAANTAWDPIKAAYAKWQAVTTKGVSAELASAHSTYSTALYVVFGLVALAALLGGWLAFWIGRGLTHSIEQLVTAADGIAEGDIEQSVEIHTHDELEHLGDSFTRMIAYLRDSATVAEQIADGDLTVEVEPRSDRDALGLSFAKMVANLRSVLTRVSSASTGMSAQSQQMAATSTEAGRAVGEIATPSATSQRAPSARADGREVARPPSRPPRPRRERRGRPESAGREADARDRQGGRRRRHQGDAGHRASRPPPARSRSRSASSRSAPSRSAASSTRSPASPSRRTCSRSTPRSRPPAPASRAAASRSSPRRSASSPRSRSRRRGRSPG